jgi:prenylcysteine oxidase/farnesylcysteine lyase
MTRDHLLTRSLLWAVFLLSTLLAQNYFQSPPLRARRIAIVGGGVAGASSAYHLEKLATTLRSDRLQVTIFEAASDVGGRVASVQIPDRQRPVPKTFESGASSFFSDDACLVDAATAVQRAGTYFWALFKDRRFGSAAVRDGKVLIEPPKITERWMSLAHAFRLAVTPGSRVFMLAPWKHHRGLPLACDYVSPTWWELAQLTQQHDLLPWRLHRAVKSAGAHWRSFGQSKSFEGVGEALAEAGIQGTMLEEDAARYLTTIGISQQFQLDVVQPCVRMRYSKNLHEVRGFDAVMALQESKEILPYGGNSHLLEDMFEALDATLHLESKVINITAGTERRYRLYIADGSKAMLNEDLEFDVVILAGNIDSLGLRKVVAALNSGYELSGNSSSYVSTHITHLASTKVLSLGYLSPGMNASMPKRLLTASDGLGGPDIFYIERTSTTYSQQWRWARTVDREPTYDDDCANGDMGEEYIYRIVSRHRVDDGELAKIMEASTEQANNNMMGLLAEEVHDLIGPDISWLHRKEWPHVQTNFEKGRPVPGKIELAKDLFYLGGGEEIYSSMEMSCRMGKNVARLLTTKGSNGLKQAAWAPDRSEL